MSVLRVALTGGIATGKSYVLARLRSKGVPTIDADVVAREVVGPGREAAQKIRERFGADVFDAHGELDRARLAALVFADAGQRQALEAIVHPEVRTTIEAWFADLSATETHTFAVADIPLLFETGRQHEFDRVIVTVCSEARQLERLMTRDGMSEEDARRRVDAQLPMGGKTAAADFVIDTGGSFQETDRQVDEVWARLRDPSADSAHDRSP